MGTRESDRDENTRIENIVEKNTWASRGKSKRRTLDGEKGDGKREGEGGREQQRLSGLSSRLI